MLFAATSAHGKGYNYTVYIAQENESSNRREITSYWTTTVTSTRPVFGVANIGIQWKEHQSQERGSFYTATDYDNQKKWLNIHLSSPHALIWLKLVIIFRFAVNLLFKFSRVTLSPLFSCLHLLSLLLRRFACQTSTTWGYLGGAA